MNKKDIDPANVQARPLNEEVNANPAAFGALRLEYDWKTFSSAAKAPESYFYLWQKCVWAYRNSTVRGN